MGTPFPSSPIDGEEISSIKVNSPEEAELYKGILQELGKGNMTKALQYFMALKDLKEGGKG